MNNKNATLGETPIAAPKVEIPPMAAPTTQLTMEELDRISRQPQTPRLRGTIDTLANVGMMGVGGAMAGANALSNIKPITQLKEVSL